MSPSLPARVLLALGATPALPPGACLPSQQPGASSDDDDETDADALSEHAVSRERDRTRSARDASRTVLLPAQALLLTSTAGMHA